MKKKHEKREDAKMRPAVKLHGEELFSVELTDDEFNALTAEQLREALSSYSGIVSVVRRADGTLTLIDYSGCDGEQFVARIKDHPDGSFTVKEYQRNKVQRS